MWICHTATPRGREKSRYVRDLTNVAAATRGAGEMRDSLAPRRRNLGGGGCALHNDGGRRDESVGWRALCAAMTADRSVPPVRSHTRSASLRRSSFRRSLGSSSFLRSLIAVGVTSTSSSSAI